MRQAGGNQAGSCQMTIVTLVLSIGSNVTAMRTVRGGGRVVSRWADLGGPLHYLDFGGPAGGPLIVCVHGLGGSAANWVAVAPLLTGGCRVVAPDLAGHGLTQSRGRGTGVAANRVLLHRFLASVALGPVILMGNSMGGMISLLEASEHPGAAAGLILVDPALPFLAARPDPLVTAMFLLYLTPGIGRAVMAYERRLPPARRVRAGPPPAAGGGGRRRPAAVLRGTRAGRRRRDHPAGRGAGSAGQVHRHRAGLQRRHPFRRRDRQLPRAPGLPAADPLGRLPRAADPRHRGPAGARRGRARHRAWESRLDAGRDHRGGPRATAGGAGQHRPRGHRMAARGWPRRGRSRSSPPPLAARRRIAWRTSPGIRHNAPQEGARRHAGGG